MICTQIMAEYKKQTKLYEQILQELKRLNDKIDMHAQEDRLHFQVDSPSRLLSIQETTKFLGISKSTIYNRLSRNSADPFPVQPKRFGRRVMFDRIELEDYLASL